VEPASLDLVRAHLAERGSSLTPSEIERLARVIVDESQERGFEPLLVLAVIEVESRFDAFAVSPVGALGLMQILPSTARAMALELGIEWQGERTLFDPESNVRIGLAYLHQLRERFQHLPTALAAYNWGPAAIGRRLRSGDPIPAGYAQRVLSAYAESTAAPMTSS